MQILPGQESMMEQKTQSFKGKFVGKRGINLGITYKVKGLGVLESVCFKVNGPN